MPPLRKVLNQRGLRLLRDHHNCDDPYCHYDKYCKLQELQYKRDGIARDKWLERCDCCLRTFPHGSPELSNYLVALADNKPGGTVLVLCKETCKPFLFKEDHKEARERLASFCHLRVVVSQTTQ